MCSIHLRTLVVSKLFMRKSYRVCACLVLVAVIFISFKNSNDADYINSYKNGLTAFTAAQQNLLAVIMSTDINDEKGIEQVRASIYQARIAMKSVDIWLRYLEPLAYKKINGPLPVEWETEVFEKYEKPYRREGAGLTLAALYLDEKDINKDSLLSLVQASITATGIYTHDSVTTELNSYHNFYLCNRLFLLNLAAIYTTGFECPDANRVVPELKEMLVAVGNTYISFDRSFPATPLSADYLQLFNEMQLFVAAQPLAHDQFDHFSFIRNYVNPLFVINQRLIAQYNVVSHSLVDYSLNKKAASIFDKGLYNGQNAKGIFLRVQDSAALATIDEVGKLLFYDPVLSGNNMRSCASCHKPTMHFTDTVVATALHFDRTAHLPRNTPSLINATYNHLVMLDGKHTTLQEQTKAVISNPEEMGCDANKVVSKVLSCKEYKTTFNKLLKYTPQESEVTYDHIVSAFTWYYSKCSRYYAPFDNAMNGAAEVAADVRQGFNLFMGKAQCATCHFVPQFNGVKPPYIGSEFEVLGVPGDTTYAAISKDEGRYRVNPAKETRHAFRTGTVRNAGHTRPYMHNGVFSSLEQVVDFYNAGGGVGRGLNVSNQTLSTDSLKLTKAERSDLIAFIRSLDEQIVFEKAPEQLPRSKTKELNARKPGGIY